MKRLPYLFSFAQFFDNYGERLVGGKIKCYDIGTTSDKVTYSDPYGTAPNTNPVILDHAGRAEIYYDGSYTLALFDRNDVLIDTIHIFGNSILGGSSLPGFAQNEIVVVENYNALRALNEDYAFVLVQGREFQADHGEGLFILDVGSTESDDDCVILQAQTTGRYRRLNVETIDPRWSGVVFDTITSQNVYLSAASVASIRHSAPLKIDGSIYLNFNFTTSAEIQFTDNGKLVSTLPITASFYNDVKGSDECFGETIQPVFFKTDEVKYSWMYAGNVEGKVAKLLACTTQECLINFDKNIETTNSIIIPSNFTFKSNSEIFFNTSSPMDLTIPSIEKVYANVFKFKQLSTIGNMTIPFEITPEFFGAIGFGADDTIPLQAALRSGKVFLTNSYVSSGAHITTEPIAIRSDDIKKSTMPTLTLSSLAFSTLLLTNVSLASSLNGTNLNTNNVRMVCDGTVNYVSLNDVEYISGKLITQEADLDSVVYTGLSVPCSKIQKLYNSQFANILMSGSDKIEGVVSNVIITPTSANSLIVKDSIIQNLYYNDSSDTYNPVLILSGSNVISNSNFYSKNYKQLSKGYSSSATFNSCTFSDKITVSESSNKYFLNGCQGGSLEVNGVRDSVKYETKIFTSGTLTDSLTNWAGKTGDDIIDVSLDGIGIKFNQSYVFNNDVYPASEIKLDELGSTYTYLYIPSFGNNLLESMTRWGGRIRVTTKNAGNSYFKICMMEPDYRATKSGETAYLTTSAGSIWSTQSPKLLAETGIISNNSLNEITTEFAYEVNQNCFRPLFLGNSVPNSFPYLITDHLGIRQDIINSSATTNFYTNSEFLFVGYVDAGTEVKIELISEIPTSNQVSETYFKKTSANTNTYYTSNETYLGNSFVSSGVNNVSNKWITETSYKKIGDKIIVEGLFPSILTSSISAQINSSATLYPSFHNGSFYGLDSWRFLSNPFNLRLEQILPTTIQNDLEIILNCVSDNTLNVSATPTKLIKPINSIRFYKEIENLI